MLWLILFVRAPSFKGCEMEDAKKPKTKSKRRRAWLQSHIEDICASVCSSVSSSVNQAVCMSPTEAVEKFKQAALSMAYLSPADPCAWRHKFIPGSRAFSLAIILHVKSNFQGSNQSLHTNLRKQQVQTQVGRLLLRTISISENHLGKQEAGCERLSLSRTNRNQT